MVPPTRRLHSISSGGGGYLGGGQDVTTEYSGNVRYVKFYVDSQAAISAIGNPRVKSHAVAEAIDNLNALAETTKSVTLVWIPAHKGHVGNERADDMAKEGTKELNPERLLGIRKPQATLKARIKDSVYAEWKKEWNTMKTANHARSFYAGPNPGKAKFVYKLARLELGRLVRIVTGHNNLRFFQTKLGLTKTPICRFCGEGNETITHIMVHCPRFMTLRNDMFGDQIPDSRMTWSVRGLLDFSYNPGINEAFEGDWKASDDWAVLEEGMGLGWLEGEGDENNNIESVDRIDE